MSGALEHKPAKSDEELKMYSPTHFSRLIIFYFIDIHFSGVEYDLTDGCTPQQVRLQAFGGTKIIDVWAEDRFVVRLHFLFVAMIANICVYVRAG